MLMFEPQLSVAKIKEVKSSIRYSQFVSINGRSKASQSTRGKLWSSTIKLNEHDEVFPSLSEILAEIK